MSKYTVCVDGGNHEERSIYEDVMGRKYLRVRENGQNSMVSLKTKSLPQAVKEPGDDQAFELLFQLTLF